MAGPVRLAFDATPLLGNRTGVGVMTARVLDRLSQRDDVSVTAYAVTWRGRGRLAGLVPRRVRAVRRPMPARPLQRAWRSVDVPPIEWFTGHIDIVHGPNFVVPPARRAARVATVHDLTAVHNPEMCTPHVRTFPAAIRRALHTGAAIHAVSDFIRDEVIALFGADPDRVFTVANGVDAIPPAEPTLGRRAAGGDRYVLALGTIEPRKNLPALVRAFDRVAASDRALRLVVAGPDGWGTDAFDAAVSACRHRDRITRLGMTDDEGRAALLRGATALAFPSLYEGFGLPPLEAMSVGLPVLTTAAGAIPEVVGDAALVVPPDDDAITEGLARIVGDAELREELSRRGPPRAACFTWDATADGLVAAYRRLTVGS
ncbi:MAG TPA: glycosyltransferase family 1 protein [Acidimicrobiales bacterium]|nr:glycosyltransferase family 1 protein [Acidimicrobiales bacterium]